MAEKKYYWLKLKRDFFKRHDIRIIEEMPNGKEYLLFYLKLLVESIDHDGELRFSDTIPYNEQMLSVITNTNVDIVRSALKLFADGLHLIEIKDDKTIYMEEVQKMIGSAVDSDVANRQRRCRERKKQQALLGVTDALQNVTDVVTNDNESKSIEKEIDKEIDKDSIKPQKRFAKPTLDDVKEYCQERGNNVDAERWYNYYSANGWKVGKNSMKDWKAAVRTWERSDDGGKPKYQRTTDYDKYTD